MCQLVAFHSIEHHHCVYCHVNYGVHIWFISNGADENETDVQIMIQMNFEREKKVLIRLHPLNHDEDKDRSVTEK